AACRRMGSAHCLGMRAARPDKSTPRSDDASSAERALNRPNARPTDSVIHAKLDRLSRGFAPRVLELCSGCGGLSLGLKVAGFELLAHIESDALAAQTYALNLGPSGTASRQW